MGRIEGFGVWIRPLGRTFPAPVVECPMCSFQCTSLLALCPIVPVQGSLEIFTGLGLILGPPLGGWLYQAYGYELPFLVLGCILLLMVPFNIMVMPSCGRGSSISVHKDKEDFLL